MWIALGVALLAMLIFIGRQVRLGRIGPGPWFRQFRTLRSVASMGLLVLGIALAARGAWLPGLAAMAAGVIFGTTVRFSGGKAGDKTAAAYTPQEIQAYQTLGLPIGADRKAVKDAWKRLMKEAHPDQGGTEVRAQALNAARDLLLKRR